MFDYRCTRRYGVPVRILRDTDVNAGHCCYCRSRPLWYKTIPLSMSQDRASTFHRDHIASGQLNIKTTPADPHLNSTKEPNRLSPCAFLPSSRSLAHSWRPESLVPGYVQQIQPRHIQPMPPNAHYTESTLLSTIALLAKPQYLPLRLSFTHGQN